VASDAEHTERVDSYVKAHVLTHLGHWLALVAEEDVRGALKTSHVASLLLGSFIGGVDWQLAAFAVDSCVVLSTTVNVGDAMALFALDWLTVVVAVWTVDVDV
jgi:hypothetical protein